MSIHIGGGESMKGYEGNDAKSAKDTRFLNERTLKRFRTVLATLEAYIRIFNIPFVVLQMKLVW